MAEGVAVSGLEEAHVARCPMCDAPVRDWQPYGRCAECREPFSAAFDAEMEARLGLKPKQPEQAVVSTGPLFLYIPPARLIVLSILSMSLYAAYWIYRNWRYVKERDRLDIQPFWRGIFGILFCHSLLRRIHADEEARAVEVPTFSPGGLATGWVILMLIANLLSRAPGVFASVIAAFIPSFLCLVPVQSYVNSVTEKRNPGLPYYGWSSGHIVCLVVGVIFWAVLFGLSAER
jgi:hypothetical protein